MKSTLISPKKKVVKQNLPEFPALFQNKTHGIIVLTTSRSGGTVIHSDNNELRKVGYVYPEGTTPWSSCHPSWQRITDPTTIKFTP